MVSGQALLTRVAQNSGNRWQGLLDDGLRHKHADDAFRHIRELALDETLMTWQEVCLVASKAHRLQELSASTNQLSTLGPAPPDALPLLLLPRTLTTLILEYNDFSCLSDLSAVADLPSLRNLYLKGNNISSMTMASPTRATKTKKAKSLVFPPSLRYLDLSYNQVASWSFINALPVAFPGLVSLRFAHNPLYDRPDTLDGPLPPSALSPPPPTTTTTTDEAYMLTVGRLASLQSLNFSAVTAADRANADMFYLGRIARHLASVPADSPAEAAVLASHPRWGELCRLYGEPDVVRRTEVVNPSFLEARLVRAVFRVVGHGGGGAATVAAAEEEGESEEGGQEAAGGRDGRRRRVQTQTQTQTQTLEIPKSFDIYKVKSIVGRVFGHGPRQLRLVWETGEWDPVAGYDEDEDEAHGGDDDDDDDDGGDDGDDDDDDDDEDKVPATDAAHPSNQQQNPQSSSSTSRGGRWIKREVEIRDGPRQFGFCVDGPVAHIRVELL
jgi:hypothetical protein